MSSVWRISSGYSDVSVMPGMVLVSRMMGPSSLTIKIAARNAQTAEGLVGRAGKFLGTRIVFGRNLRRNTVNIRRVDVL